MTPHPILMSGPMVRALLAGEKTMTRRLLSPMNCTVLGSRWPAWAWSGLKFDHPRAEIRTQSSIMVLVTGSDAPYDLHVSVPFVHPDDEAAGITADDEDEVGLYRVRPIYEPGDLLWVRERWTHDGPDIATVRSRYEDALSGGIGFGPYYLATESAPDTLKWRPSIHMPLWASRLTLRVTDVKLERLQEISEADAIREGAPNEAGGNEELGVGHRIGFVNLWNSLHGPGAWERNPIVVAIGFDVIRENVERVMERPAA